MKKISMLIMALSVVMVSEGVCSGQSYDSRLRDYNARMNAVRQRLAEQPAFTELTAEEIAKMNKDIDRHVNIHKELGNTVRSVLNAVDRDNQSVNLNDVDSISAARTKILKIISELQNNNQQMIRNNALISDNQNRNKEVNERISILLSQIAGLTTENMSLRSEVQQAQRTARIEVKKRELKGKLDAKDAQIRNLRSEIAGLEGERDRIQSENSTLQEQNERICADNRELAERILQMIDKHQSILAENSKLKNALQKSLTESQD